MSIQLIIAVEANKESKSDYRYIDPFIKRYFKIGTNKISYVYMGSKMNYSNQGIKNQITSLINSYRKTGESHVIYCFDTDDFSVSPDHQANDEKIKKDLVHNSDIVWFNRDIEEVFINSRLENAEKKSKSIDFLAKGLIKSVSYQLFTYEDDFVGKRRSNLGVVISKYLEKSSE